MGEFSLPMTGGCLCGAIRYEASEPPNLNGTCQCRKCQKWTGSAYSTFAGFPKEAFRFTQGEPKFYKSSAIMERAFCADCGSGLANRYLFPEWGGRVFVGIGTLDDPEAVPLNFHFGAESQLSWVHFDDGLHSARCDEDPVLAAALAAAERNKG
jgi:hypothetical protein